MSMADFKPFKPQNHPPLRPAYWVRRDQDHPSNLNYQIIKTDQIIKLPLKLS